MKFAQNDQKDQKNEDQLDFCTLLDTKTIKLPTLCAQTEIDANDKGLVLLDHVLDTNWVRMTKTDSKSEKQKWKCSLKK